MGFSIIYDVDLRDAADLIEKIAQVSENQGKQIFLKEAGKAGEIIMKREAPWGERPRGPRLRDSIIQVFPGDDTVEIFPTKKVDGIDLAFMIEQGTRGGSLIVPKRRKALRFITGLGRVAYARSVRRGVTKPNRFVKRTATLLGQLIVGIASAAYEKAYTELNNEVS